jgi:hypothetical protein
VGIVVEEAEFGIEGQREELSQGFAAACWWLQLSCGQLDNLRKRHNVVRIANQAFPFIVIDLHKFHRGSNAGSRVYANQNFRYRN